MNFNKNFSPLLADCRESSRNRINQDQSQNALESKEKQELNTLSDEYRQIEGSDQERTPGPLITKESNSTYDDNYSKMNDLTFLDAFKNVTQNSLLPMLQTMLLTVSQSINLLVLGHSENSVTFLAAYGLGNMAILVSMQSLNFGLSNTLPQYVSQAYSVGDYKLCGAYRNRQVLINYGVISLTALVVIWCKPFFLLLNQTEEVSSLAQQYVYILIPGQYCFGQLLCNQRFCYGQKQMLVPFISQIVALLSQIISLYVLSFMLENTFYVIAISSSMMFAFGLISVKILINYKPELARSNTSFFAPESFVNILPQFKVAVSGFSLVLWCMWAIEASVFLSAVIGELYVACQSLLNTFVIQFHSFALGIQSQMFIGYSLGLLNIETAKKYSNASITLGVCMASASFLLLITFKNVIISALSSSEEIQQLIEYVYFQFALNIFLFMTYETFKGIALGINKQGVGSLISFISNWIIAVPIQALAVIYQWNFQVFWLGINLGSFFRMVGLMLVVICIDWEKTIQVYIARRNLENMN